MKNIKIVLSFYGKLSIGSFLNAIQAILSAFATNPHFPTPNPPIQDIQNNLNDLRVRQAAVDSGNQGIVPARNQLKDTIIAQIYLLANYVLYTSTSTSDTADDAIVKIQSVNFVVQGAREPVGPLPGVTNLRSTNLSQSVALEWTDLYGAHAYSVVMTTQNPNDPQAVWNEVALTTRSKAVIENLTPGQPLAFKVYALGSVGKGQPSDVVTAMAVM